MVRKNKWARKPNALCPPVYVSNKYISTLNVFPHLVLIIDVVNSIIGDINQPFMPQIYNGLF